ncbi:hypothetical protein NBRC116596_02120 [Litorivita sp. NS0012-18]
MNVVRNSSSGTARAAKGARRALQRPKALPLNARQGKDDYCKVSMVQQEEPFIVSLVIVFVGL